MRVAAALETFLSEWVVRALCEDPERFRVAKEKRATNRLRVELDKWVIGEFGDALVPVVGAALNVTLGSDLIPRQPTIDQSRSVLKAQDSNLSFPDSQALYDFVMVNIGTTFTHRLKRLTQEQRAVIDATKALRNCLAHASPRSKRALNTALRAGGLPPALRIAPVHSVNRPGIGRYLYLTPAGSAECRIRVLFGLLRDLAYVLEPARGAKLKVCP